MHSEEKTGTGNYGGIALRENDVQGTEREREVYLYIFSFFFDVDGLCVRAPHSCSSYIDESVKFGV